jgi:hypothetical protein
MACDSIRALLSRETGSRAVRHMTASELSQVGRRGPKPRDTWQHRSRPQREVRIRSYRHVAVRPAPCLGLKPICGIPYSQGTDSLFIIFVHIEEEIVFYFVDIGLVFHKKVIDVDMLDGTNPLALWLYFFLHLCCHDQIIDHSWVCFLQGPLQLSFNSYINLLGS